MDPSCPATLVAYWELLRQHFPAPPFAYCRGDVWALAMLGTTRPCRTTIARTGVFVERPLASWERFLAESPWDLRGGSQTLGRPLVQQGEPSVDLWDALLAAGSPPRRPKVRGQLPGGQNWHDQSGDPARGESWVGPHWPLLARLLPGQLKPLGFRAGAEGMPRLDCWAVVVALVRELPQEVGNRPLRVVAAADFRKASCLNPLRAAGITVISRLRQEAVGCDEPAPVVGKRPRGRPRKQGPAWKLAPLPGVDAVTALVVTIAGQEERLRVVWRDLWLRDVTGQVRVVVMATEHAPILLVSPALTLPPAVIIPLAAARFPMELSLRDLQPSGGRGD